MRTLTTALFLIAFLRAAQADPILTLNPSSGTISGTPGSTVGWCFDLTSDSANWLSITDSMVLTESNPLGTYTDYIGLQGGPFSGALPPGAPDWVEDFDAEMSTGLGAYSIDPLAPAGQSDSGLILVQYEIFSDNPATCGSCFLDSGELFENFTVNTVATPEPSMFPILLAIGLLASVLLRMRRRLIR